MFVVSLEKDCFNQAAFKREFFYFNMASRRLQQFHFTVYSIMNMITVFSILLQLHGVLLASLVNQKMGQQTILDEILTGRPRTVRQIRTGERKNLNKKKELAGIKLVIQT